MNERFLSFEPFESGIMIKLTKKYIRKDFHFYITCFLPLPSDYLKQDYVHPSFLIKTPFTEV